MEIPQTGASSITAVSAFSLIRLGFKELGQSLPVPSFRDAQLDGASSPLSVPVTVIRGSSPGQAAVLDQLLRLLRARRRSGRSSDIQFHRLFAGHTELFAQHVRVSALLSPRAQPRREPGFR
ncbi:hypothetical protein QR78_10705 [Methylobacterium indicum]|uniref:LysR substrate-binding domain-containing protein n=1 Tax=Methylobacterium indicum TaxID=1775910 RepID=A0ABR5HDK8_9HYPH|nr:hypothetical protein QR78_10705 [Methylobacterium indicum]KMO23343.1 hypothetical protein QR79_13590 [Methylobacterium indicum]